MFAYFNRELKQCRRQLRGQRLVQKKFSNLETVWRICSVRRLASELVETCNTAFISKWKYEKIIHCRPRSPKYAELNHFIFHKDS